MPTYDYVCHHCGHRFEVIHGVHADGPRNCPNCGGGPVLKAVAAPAIHFKGSGWAKKDRHAARSGSSSRKGDDGSDSAAAATGTRGDGDTKSGGSSEGSKSSDSKGSDSKGSDSKSSESKGSASKPASSAGEGG